MRLFLLRHADAVEGSPDAGRDLSPKGQRQVAELAAHRDEIVISTKAGYKGWEGPYGDWGSRKYTLASLDHLTGGRAGWNLVTSVQPAEAPNFGRPGVDKHEVRYARARGLKRAMILVPGIPLSGHVSGPGGAPQRNVNINVIEHFTRVSERISHDATDAAGNFTNAGGILPGYTDNMTRVRAVPTSTVAIVSQSAYKDGARDCIQYDEESDIGSFIIVHRRLIC